MESFLEIIRTTTMKANEIPMMEQMENTIALPLMPITSNALMPLWHRQKNMLHTKSIILRIFLLIAIAVILSLGIPNHSFAQNWYNTNWNYRKSITIDYTKVPNTDQSNFPALVNLTSDAGLLAHALASGNDILFTSSDGITKVPYQRESYASGTLVAWVQVPVVSHTANTVIYIYYGNPGASDQQQATSVWDANYKGVWHLDEATGSNSADATSNSNTATPLNSPTQGAARISGGLTFNGTTMENNVSSTFGLGTANVTMECWANLSSTSLHGAFIKIGGTSPNQGYALGVGSGVFETSGNSVMVLYEGARWITAGAYTTGWHHFVLVIDGSGYPHVYYDGAQMYTDATGAPLTPQQSITHFGGYTGSGGEQRHFNETLDEIRISNNVRSADWIKTEYNNQNSPSTFYSVGAEGGNYVWNHSVSTDWQVAGNWTPARTTPQITDILQFNIGGSVTVSNVPTQTISQLLLSNGTTVNFQAASAPNTLTVSDVLTTTAGDVLNLGTGVILAGTLTTLTNNGTIITSNTSASPITSGKTWGGTVQYNATTGAQTAMAGTYNNLTLSNTSGTQTASGALTVNGTLITTAGGTLNMVTNQLLGTLTTVTNGGTIQTQNISATPIPTGKTWGGTIQYDGVSQTVSTGIYNNLTLAGNGAKSIASGTSVTGNLSISGATASVGAGLNISVGSLTLGGLNKISGTWGSTSSSATNKDNTYFAATTGIVTVTTDTRLTPVFSGLTASQGICFGTATVTLGGTISAAGPIYPVNGETVIVTINTVPQNATIAGGVGGFSINFNSAAIPVSGTPYTITYSYAGNGNLKAAANNTSTALTVNALPIATFSYTATPYCKNAANPSPTFSGGGVAGTFSSTAGLVFVSTTTGQVNLAASTAGTYTVTNTIAASGGCGIVTATSPITITPILPVSLSIAPSINPVCPGTSVTFTATPTNGGTTPVYQWNVNGINAGTNSSTYTYTPANNDAVTCVLTSNASCATGSPATSNTVTMVVNPNLPASVIISSTATTICSGSSVTFTATPSNGGSTPSYQWKLNGSNVGTNSTTYNNSSLANGNTVTCVMTSNANCATGSPAISNAVTMTVNPLSVAPTSISGTAAICNGGSTTLTAEGGMIAYYPFASDVNDYSGSGLHLSGSGGSFTGGGIQLSNASSYTSVATPILNTDKYTISFDMKYTAVPSGSWRKIFGYTPSGTDRSPGIWRYDGAMKLHWRHDPGNTGLVESFIYTINQWYHVVGEKNGSTFTLYVDGVQVDQGTVVNTKTSGTSALVFGAAGTYGGADVILKEFKIYNGDLRWYTGSCGGTLVGSGPSITVTPGTSTTYFFREEGICNTTTCASQLVTVYGNVTAAISGGSTPICYNTAPGTFTATGGGGTGSYTYLWYKNGSPTGVTTQSYAPGVLTATSTFYCAITSGSCGTVNTSTTTITVFGNLTAAISGGSTPICYNAAPGTFTATGGGGTGSYTYLWYMNGTTTGVTTQTYAPGALTATSTFYCAITSGSCGTVNTSTTTITVNPNLPVSISIAPSANPVCSGTSVTFSATPTNGGTTPVYQWKVNGTSVGPNSVTYTYAPSNNDAFTCVLTSNAVCATGSPATSNTVTMTVNTSPTITGTTPGSVCGTGTVTLGATASAGTINWYAAPLGGSSLGTGTSFTTPGISSTTTYYVDASANGCTTASRTAVTATVNTIPTITGTTPGSVCLSGTVTLGATASAGTINWYAASSGGSSLGTGTSFTTPGLSSTTTYYVDATANGCTTASRTAVTATVNTIPTITGATPGSRCGSGTVTLGATASAGTINWYAASSGGSSLGTGITFTTSSLSATTTYYVDANDGVCTSAARTPVIASIIPAASISAGGGGTFCSGSNVTLTSSGTNITSQYWIGPNSFYSLSQNPVLSNVTSAMTGTYTVTGSAFSGINLASNGNFESGIIGFTSAYTVAQHNSTGLQPEGTYDVIANPQSEHSSFSSCGDHTSGSGLQMVVNGTTGANVSIWAQTVNVATNTDYRFTYWVQSVYASNPSQLQLYVNGVIAGPVYTAITSTCQWSQFTYNWNSGSSTTAYLSLVNQNTISNGNDFAIDDIVFQQACSAISSVIVTVNNPVTAGAVASDQTICSGTAPITLTSFTAGTGSGTISYEWQTNASGSFVTIGGAVAATYSPPTLSATTSYQRRTVSLSGGTTCYSAYTTPVTITVTPAPTAVAGTMVTTCSTSGAVNITVGSNATNYTSVAWTSSGTGTFANANSLTACTYTPSAADISAGSVTLTLTAVNSPCADATSTKTLTITTAPTVMAGTAVTTCSTSGALNITAGTSATNYASIAWTSSGTGTFANANSLTTCTYTPSVADISTGSITLTLTATGNSPCANATSTKTLSITTLPVATFSYTGTTYCSNAANPSPTFSGGGIAGTFSSTAGLVFVSTATGQVNLAASTAGTYTVTNTIAASGGCGIVTATSPITITTLPAATFSYAGTPYCSSAANPSPIFSGGGVAGTFSSTAGLVFVSTSTGQVNIAASTAGTYTVTNTVAASGGCGIVTSTSPITISTNLPVSISVSPSTNPVCPGTSVTLTASPTNGGTTPAYQWKVNGVSVGTNSTTYTYTPAGNDAVTCVLTSNATCATGSPATSNVVTLSLFATGSWLGITSTDWHTASNWCGGIPTATTDVTIPSGGNQPVISAIAVCNNITINSGATLTISGSNTLTVSGNWTNSGTFTPNSSTVNFNSSGSSNISAGNFNNITISGSGTKNATGAIMASGNFNLTAGQFNLNNSTSNNITISGNYTQTGGVFDFNIGTSGACTMFIGGNISHTAGAGSMTTSGGGAPNGTIVFNGSVPQTLSITAPGGAIWVKYSVPSGKSVQLLSNITLNSADGSSQAVFQGEILVNGTFDLGTSTVTQNNGVAGTAVFTVNSGATLITANTSGIDGSIASTNMTRTLSSGANYKFNGIASQVTSAGMPASLNNLTIDNGAGVSLTSPVTINGSLAITTGAFSTGSNTLTFQNSNTPIIRTSGTITTTENTNLVFGTSGNTGGAAFAIPSGCFTSAPQINNFTINRINSLTLNNQMLNVKGILLCNGPLNTNNNLTLLSTSAQTALIDGTGTGDVTGNVTMQRYLATGFGYKYFSSPFQNATVGQFSSYVNLSASFPTFYSYNENVLSTGWVNYTNSAGSLAPMKGYAVNFGTAPAAITVSLIGTVNNNTLSPLTLTNNNKPYTKGFNLIGNPYPSPIDWDAASGWTKTNVDNAVYFFNAGNNGANGLANDSLQYQGTYSSYVNGIPTGNATNIIPSMQGFFVHVTDGTFPVSATLGISNSVRTNDLNPSFKSMDLNTRPLIRLSAGFTDNGMPSDPAVIYFDDSSTLSFDTDLDALKLMNTDARVPSLYAITPDAKRVSISGMPYPTDSITWVPLGLKTGIQGWVTFNASDIEQLPPGMHVYLVDAVTHITQDLNINPLYRLLLKAGVYENRFSLVFSLSERIPTPIAVVSETFTITRTTGILVINPNLPVGEKGILQMVNMMGQVLYRKEVFGNEAIELNSRLSSGVYVISMISGNKIYSKKIVILKE